MEFCFLHPQRIKDQKPRRIDERTSKVVKCSLLSNYYHKKQSQWVKSSKSTDSSPNFCKLGLMGFRKNQLTSFHLREQNLPCAFPFLSFGVLLEPSSLLSRVMPYFAFLLSALKGKETMYGMIFSLVFSSLFRAQPFY